MEEEGEPNEDFTKIEAGAASGVSEGVATDLAKAPEGALGVTGGSTRLLLLDCAADATLPPNKLVPGTFEKRGESTLLPLAP